MRPAVLCLLLLFACEGTLAGVGRMPKQPVHIVRPGVRYQLLQEKSTAAKPRINLAGEVDMEDAAMENEAADNSTNSTTEEAGGIKAFFASIPERAATALVENTDYSDFLFEGGDAPAPGYPGAALTDEDVHALSKEDLKYLQDKQDKDPRHGATKFRVPKDFKSPEGKKHLMKLVGMLLMVIGSVVTIPPGRISATEASKCGPKKSLLKELPGGWFTSESKAQEAMKREMKKGKEGCRLPMKYSYTKSSLRKRCRSRHCGVKGMADKDMFDSSDLKSGCPECCECPKPISWMKQLFIQILGFLLMLIGGFIMFLSGVALGGTIFWLLWLLAVVSNIVIGFRCHYSGC